MRRYHPVCIDVISPGRSGLRGVKGADAALMENMASMQQNMGDFAKAEQKKARAAEAKAQQAEQTAQALAAPAALHV